MSYVHSPDPVQAERCVHRSGDTYSDTETASTFRSPVTSSPISAAAASTMTSAP